MWERLLILLNFIGRMTEGEFGIIYYKMLKNIKS